MNLKNRQKAHLKLIEKYVFKPIFCVEKIMKLICNKLGNEDQHMFQQVIKKKIYFVFVRTYLTTT
jgi:hypothetical protein